MFHKSQKELGSAFGADAGALVLAIATLSFLGLGVAPPTPEWGQMLVDGMSYIEEYPSLVVIPGLALTLVVVSFNLLGEAFALYGFKAIA